MYLNQRPRKRLGQDDGGFDIGGMATDALTSISSPIDSIGLSPLMLGGLGLLLTAFLVSRGRKTVKRFKRRRRASLRRSAAIKFAKSAA